MHAHEVEASWDRLASMPDMPGADRLHALGRAETGELAQAVEAAADLESLRQASLSVGRFAASRVRLGMGAALVSPWLSSLNDRIAMRAIELARQQHDLPDVPWCWLSFGSEGRLEQTLATDQDNGLIFEARDAGQAAILRAAFLPFAQEVNRLLDACGFPLCKGGVMAGNAGCCLSLAEWQGCFRAWIGHADPTALLNASIFFDLRPLYGERRLADELQAGLLAHVAEFPLFLHLMAANALDCQPPLGLIRDFVLDRRTGRIDLKRDGSRIFVDAARLFALACGRPETGTEARLRAVGKILGWRLSEVDACVASFYAIVSFRLRQQLVALPGEENLIDPDALNVLDRVVLKESLRQARLLQERLRMRYPS